MFKDNHWYLRFTYFIYNSSVCVHIKQVNFSMTICSCFTNRYVKYFFFDFIHISHKALLKKLFYRNSQRFLRYSYNMVITLKLLTENCLVVEINIWPEIVLNLNVHKSQTQEALLFLFLFHCYSNYLESVTLVLNLHLARSIISSTLTPLILLSLFTSIDFSLGENKHFLNVNF